MFESHPAPTVETAATNCTKPACAGSLSHIRPVGAGRLRVFRRREFISRPVERLSTVSLLARILTCLATPPPRLDARWKTAGMTEDGSGVSALGRSLR